MIVPVGQMKLMSSKLCDNLESRVTINIIKVKIHIILWDRSTSNY